MLKPLLFNRLLFILLSMLFFISYSVTALSGGANLTNILIGFLGGIGAAALMIFLEFLLKDFQTQYLNLTAAGLIFGSILGHIVLYILDQMLIISSIPLSTELLQMTKAFIYLVCCYLAVFTTINASDTFYMSIPFVRLKSLTQQKKDILLDSSVLQDPRILDLAATGILNHSLILPKFVVKELFFLSENGDELGKSRARRALDAVKKLEAMPALDLRTHDNDSQDLRDVSAKIFKLAKTLNADILVSDLNLLQHLSNEGVDVITLQKLANALKPITQTGEFLSIKILRGGKDPGQGIGYLEDGTMVVVNGGARYMEKTIKTQVISVKNTLSGRLIFCNTAEENEESYNELEPSPKNYFAQI